VKKCVLVLLFLCLILPGGRAFGADQIVIVFDGGTSQTVDLKGPTYSIRSIQFKGGVAATTVPDNRITVIAGTYGKNCGAPYGNMTNHLAGACNNQSRCEYTIDYQVIGDPAFGCSKDYVAEWRCGGDSRMHQTSASPEAGLRKKIVLSCPQ
jgi:hypothetical protein